MSIKKYKGHRFVFFLGEYISKGGNGIVHNVKCQCEGKKELVIKIFKYDDLNKPVNLKKYKRFIREIETVLSIQDSIDGLLKIIDYSYDDENAKKPKAWYVMEKAEQFKIDESMDIVTKLYKMIELGEIIQQLHNNSPYYAHRDIKPSNIFILDNKIKLSDFGLVWCNEYEKITDFGERIGPIRILPPELERVYFDLEEEIDFRKSDVYLFAKVIWMCLKRNDYGFAGEYNRRDKYIYLNKNGFDKVDTFEPIHLLLENATKHNYEERISIDKCLEYLSIQIEILEGRLNFDEKNKFIYEETTKEIINTLEPNSYAYSETAQIVKILNRISSYSTIFLKGRGIEECLKLVNGCFDIEGNHIRLNIDMGSIQRQIYFFPKELVIENDLSYVLRIKDDEKDELKHLELYSSSGLIPNLKSKINEEYTLRFEKQ